MERANITKKHNVFHYKERKLRVTLHQNHSGSRPRLNFREKQNSENRMFLVVEDFFATEMCVKGREKERMWGHGF